MRENKYFQNMSLKNTLKTIKNLSQRPLVSKINENNQIINPKKLTWAVNI